MHFPDTITMPVISTGHVMENDLELCVKNDPENPVVAYPFEYGVWCYISEDDGMDVSMRAFGLSENFITVYLAVKNEGYRYMCLDCDGMEVEGLPFTNW